MRKEERGITLLALIITIIILVILALITISAVYTSGIIQFGVNGAKDYAEAAIEENKIMTETESYMSSVVEEIHKLMNNESKSEDEELPELQVGDYVDYHPTDSTYVAKGQVTGYDENNKNAEVGVTDQTLSTDTEVSWRVYNKDDDNIYLISAKPVNSNFYLQGVDGYNNAVYVLNEACSTMYSNEKYNAKARSLNIDDVRAISNYDEYEDFGYYGLTRTYTDDNAWYPNIFAFEKEQSVDNGNKGTLGVSEQDKIYSGSSNATSITVYGNQKDILFEDNNFYLDEAYIKLLHYDYGMSPNYSSFYLASRFANVCDENHPRIWFTTCLGVGYHGIQSLFALS